MRLDRHVGVHGRGHVLRRNDRHHVAFKIGDDRHHEAARPDRPPVIEVGVADDGQFARLFPGPGRGVGRRGGAGGGGGDVEAIGLLSSGRGPGSAPAAGRGDARSLKTYSRIGRGSCGQHNLSYIGRFRHRLVGRPSIVKCRATGINGHKKDVRRGGAMLSRLLSQPRPRQVYRESMFQCHPGRRTVKHAFAAIGAVCPLGTEPRKHGTPPTDILFVTVNKRNLSCFLPLSLWGREEIAYRERSFRPSASMRSRHSLRAAA